MPPPTPEDQAARACKQALDLIHHIDALQAQIRRAEQGLDHLAWHAFSIAYSASDTDADTKPTPGELKAFARQVKQLASDIQVVEICVTEMLPICTQKMGE